MVFFFDHRASTYQDVAEVDVSNGKARYPSSSERRDQSWEPTFRVWTTRRNFDDRMANRSANRNWLLCMRDKARAADERTAIFALRPYLPSNDTLPSIFVDASPSLTAALLANLSSLTVDFLARQKVGSLNLAAFIVEQLPVVPPDAYDAADLAFIVPRVLELSFTSWSMEAFARDLAYKGPPFEWDECRRASLRAELDAWYALAYGLSRDELRYILDPKEVMGADYPSETFRVLQKNEIAELGEYRTGRLVLAAYDRMIAEGARRRVEGWKQ